jgi:uncharacterized protein with PIN domain
MPPAFAVERTLGRLGKWLRLMGFDTLLERDCPRDSFPEQVGAERVLLTRMRSRFRAFPAGHALFIAADDPPAQLAQVVRELGLRESDLRPFTRCLRCNDLIEPAARADIESQVPRFVWENQVSFSRCRRCGRVYWKGSHTERASASLCRLFPDSD